MKKFLMLIGFLSVSTYAHAGSTPQPIIIPSSIIVSSVTAGAGGTATVTISTPSAPSTLSAGGYTYISNIHIEMYSTSTLTAVATPVSCTSTGLPTNVTYLFQTAQAAGTEQLLDMQFANPLVSSQATQVTFTCPATSNVKWNLQVAYFQSN